MLLKFKNYNKINILAAYSFKIIKIIFKILVEYILIT